MPCAGGGGCRATEWFRLAGGCDRILSGQRPVSLRQRLASLAETDLDLDGRADSYGDGPVAVLEQRVARLLGKPAAVFFPTGTMAQQVALRCWAEHTGEHRGRDASAEPPRGARTTRLHAR